MAIDESQTLNYDTSLEASPEHYSVYGNVMFLFES